MSIKILTEIRNSFENYNDDIIDDILLSLNLSKKAANETRKMLNNNSKALLDSINTHNNILVYGDVQSGKTNNLIAFIDKYRQKNKIDVVLYLTGRLNEINYQNHKRFSNMLGNRPEYNVLPGMLENYEDVPTIEHQRISKGSTLILSALNRPNKVKEFIKMIEEYDYSFLIVNDEADENNFSKKAMENFKEIKSFFNKYNGKQISISASPYNNLTTDIYDDYLVLETTSAYSGIKEFKIGVIEKNGEEVYKELLIEWALSSIGKKDSQFLINLSIWNDDHEIISEQVNNALLFLTQQHIKEIIYDKYPVEIAKHVVKTLVDVKVHNNILISNSKNNTDIKMSQKGHYVIIGGNNLSRGVTFENLDLEYIEAKKGVNAGTLLQRARWCGYRKNLDGMKIIGNKFAFKGFKELERLNEITKRYDLGENDYYNKVKEENFEIIKVVNLGGK